MSTITSLGIGAGMDTGAMLDKLQQAEQLRLQPYTKMQGNYNSKISAWGQISSSMSAFQASVKALTGDAFNTLTVSTNKAFTAKASSGASADTHSVIVKNLASGHKLITNIGTPPNKSSDLLGDQNGNTRTITVTTGDGKTTTVQLKDDETSLDQIAKAINKQDSNVQASVQRTGSGYQLMLSSQEMGSDGEMTVSVTGDQKLSDILSTSHGGVGSGKTDNAKDKMNQISAATDAVVSVDGVDYKRSSNTITDILTGVTLTLNDKSEAGKSEQLTLNRDNSAIKSGVRDFVDKYNALLKVTTSSSKYVANTGSSDTEDVQNKSSDSGPLMGDSTLRGMVGDIRGTVNGLYGDGDSKVRALADLGIKIDAATGQMTLDDSKLDTAVTNDPDAISHMFMGRGNQPGLATSLTTIVTKYLGDPTTKKDGVIKGATDGLDAQVKLMQTQIDNTQKLIDAQVARDRKQFEDLDTAMSKMNSLSSQMTSMLSKL